MRWNPDAHALIEDPMPTDFESALKIAQALIQDEGQEVQLNAEIIKEKVIQAISLKPKWAETVDLDEMIRVLETRFSIWVEKASFLVGDDDPGRWLTAEHKQTWKYWPRYRASLEADFGQRSLDALDEDTDRIVELLGDSKRAGSWDRRGLVVGDIQSGKTGNLIGVINKAADLGFKMIVILAGMHDNLRVQTQTRLDEGFLGYKTGPMVNGGNGPRDIIGVGLEDSSVRPGCVTHRGDGGDFRKQDAIRLGITPGDRPLLFVVKKNGSVLRNLLTWMTEHVANATDPGTGQARINGIPLLVIDDEADQASVDTGAQVFDDDGNPDPDYEPKAINAAIRKILRTSEQSAYIGYTATPFANIFIHEQGITAECGEDLFPRSFIVNLESPSDYTGSARMFGLPAGDAWEGFEPLPLIRRVEDHADSLGLDERHGWMPPKHNKEFKPVFKGQDCLPDSLEEAILAFLLAIAGRRARGQVKKHNTMLVHVTRFQNVQREVARQIRDYLADTKRRLKLGTANEELLLRMKDLWEEDFVPTIGEVGGLLPPAEPVPDWDQIKGLLPLVADDIKIMEINGAAGEALAYELHKDSGLNVIAVGGDKLSRGLTLEGLSISYFLRASKMYDTLMQMGRWFGYRPGYLDLTRLYTTPELTEWFQHMAEASTELRTEFNHMAVIGGTPRDYGLKVRSHPLLLVTSKVKMRNSLELQLSFSGRLAEMVVFHRDSDRLAANTASTNAFLSRLGKPAAKKVTRKRLDGQVHTWDDILYWEDVPADQIVGFLKEFQIHPKAYTINATLMSDYIEKLAGKEFFTSWTVAVMKGDGADGELAGNPIKLVKRRPNFRFLTLDEQKKDGRFLIRRLLNPRDEGIDLDDSQYDLALAKTIAEYEGNKARSKRKLPPDLPSGFYLREVRPKNKGLLLIYPLSPTDGDLQVDIPVIGLGISFPKLKKDEDEAVTYRVNNTYFAQELGGDA
jgi:hypothetical protein